MQLGKPLLLLGSFFLVLPCWGSVPPRWTRHQIKINKSFFIGPLYEGPVTLFIHGTKTSCITRALCNLEFPYGINPVNLVRKRSLLKSIAYTLNGAYPDTFPLDSFYFYSWEGNLTFPSRWRAAQRLYPILKQHDGPITLITHSHGANVAFYVARCAELDNNHTFKIDRLIMLAPPVQEATKRYAYSPVFKEIFNIYSTADVMQVADTQGTYPESKREAPPGTCIPFFSERTFPCAPHIWQIRLLIDGQSPTHLHFLLHRFIQHLPTVMCLAQRAGSYQKTNNCCLVNIPRGTEAPHLLNPHELKRNYIPRSQCDRRRRLTPFKPDEPRCVKNN